MHMTNARWMVAAIVASAVWAAATAAQPSDPEGAGTPLDRGVIAETLKNARAGAEQCAHQTPVPGAVKVHVRVAPSGDVVDAAVTQAPDSVLGGCVATAVAKLKFPPSSGETVFTYSGYVDTGGAWVTGSGGGGNASGSGSATAVTPQPAPSPYEDATPPPKPKPPRKPDPKVDLPQLITTPTGWLLPAAVLYSRTGLDTGGGFTSDQRVGLGDVAEFGLATLDQIRAVKTGTDPLGTSDHVQPYVAATFRMGVSEDRLFGGQPGLVLGFRKSFERDTDGYTTRIAELTLVASKKFGGSSSLHLGAAFWDASLHDDVMNIDTTLHGLSNVGRQLRPFAGILVRPLDKSEIMVDFGWAPVFCYHCAPADQIKLQPELAWGVRYDVADWMKLESGVRVAEISTANLLDAQIFGMVTFVTWGLRHAVDDLK
jgi:hypothetical protein